MLTGFYLSEQLNVCLSFLKLIIPKDLWLLNLIFYYFLLYLYQLELIDTVIQNTL